MECNYTHPHYSEILHMAKQNNYNFYTATQFFELPKLKEPFIILAHDIDIHPKYIEPIMAVEDSLNIKATYFFRVHAAYNLLNYDNYKIMQELIGSGHEIGLHFDSDFGSLFNESLMYNLTRDLKFLDSITKIKSVSVHDPNRSNYSLSKVTFKDNNLNLCNYGAINEKVKYISDSWHRWREDCPCKWIGRLEPRIWILVHPFWWHPISSCQNF